MLLPAEALSRRGHKVEVSYQVELNNLSNELRGAATFADVIVFQRIGSSFSKFTHLPEAFKTAEERGQLIVHDNDDNMFLIPEWNPAKQHWPPEVLEIHKRALAYAHLNTFSTEELAESYQSNYKVKRFKVLRNCLPDFTPEPHAPLAKSGLFNVVFSGSITHSRDLFKVLGVMKRFLERHRDARFVVLGGLGLRSDWDDYAKTVAERLMGLPQVILFDWLPYKMMLEIIAACDVGLAPLMNVPFNEQKSELKLLEYALCSTPFLASPLPSYVRLLSEIGDGEEGCGFLCRTPEDWEGWLERLYEDQDLLQAMAERCRAKIAPYRIKEKAHLWEEAYLEGLAQIRRLGLEDFGTLEA